MISCVCVCARTPPSTPQAQCAHARPGDGAIRCAHAQRSQRVRIQLTAKTNFETIRWEAHQFATVSNDNHKK